MADKHTSTDLFRAPGRKAPSEPTVDTSYQWEPGFAERSRDGRLHEADDLARVQGRLGGVTDSVELSDKIRAATGGHDNIWPLTNPMPPAAQVEAVLHPGVANSPDLIREVDLERAVKAHKAARGE